MRTMYYRFSFHKNISKIFPLWITDWPRRITNTNPAAAGGRRHPRAAGGGGGIKLPPFTSPAISPQRVGAETRNFAHTYLNT